NLPAYIGKRQSFMAQTLRRGMPPPGGDAPAVAARPGGGKAGPPSQRPQSDAPNNVSVADHPKGPHQGPHRTPVRGPDPTPAAHRGVEEYVGRVGRGRRGNDANGDQRIDGKIHVCVSAMSLKWFWRNTELGGAATDHLIASGLVGEPTAPVIGIAGATNMNS